METLEEGEETRKGTRRGEKGEGREQRREDKGGMARKEKGGRRREGGEGKEEKGKRRRERTAKEESGLNLERHFVTCNQRSQAGGHEQHQ